MEHGSFRDPRGYVTEINGEICRVVNPVAFSDWDFLVSSGLLEELVSLGWLTSAKEIKAPPSIGESRLLIHDRLKFISYPYEWSFSLLKAAALHHIDVHLKALEFGMTLSDASSYNIQFDGTSPIFIDTLSFIRYDEGMLWAGHKQFCDHFLNPLLLSSLYETAFTDLLRGNLEGISSEMISQFLPLSWKLKPKVFLNVVLPARLQKKTLGQGASNTKTSQKGLPKTALQFMLNQLRSLISGLSPKIGNTTWGDYYDNTQNYLDDEAQAKHQIVAEFVSQYKPEVLWDMGCNTGEFSETALNAGATQVIGFDFDPSALEGAYNRAKSKSLNILPLYQDAANPSPNQGWRGQERKSLQERVHADAMIALAFEHHLAIGRNIPISELTAWLVSLAPVGLIEFVPKGDSNLDRLLLNREDIFTDYTAENFENALKSVAEIRRADIVSSSGRTLLWYERTS